MAEAICLAEQHLLSRTPRALADVLVVVVAGATYREAVMKAAHVNSSYAVCGAEGPFANSSQGKHRSLGGNALRPHKLRSYCARLVFRVPCCLRRTR